jgi:hypothetical protein
MFRGTAVLLRRFAALLALVLPMTLLTATLPATAGSDSEFVSRTNGARTSHGIRAYAVRGDLTAVARRQAERMASSGRMYHNPSLGSEVGGWSSIGENVGRGPDVASIHNAFMNSSSHRSNILSTAFTEIGVGTARSSSGELFVSEVFRRPSGVSYTPPAPRAAPKPVYQRPVVRQRASRSAPRKPIVVRQPARKRVVVDPTPARLRAAWRVYRRARPVTSLERAVVFLRTTKIVAD